jgi:hypothetical protein
VVCDARFAWPRPFAHCLSEIAGSVAGAPAHPHSAAAAAQSFSNRHGQRIAKVLTTRSFSDEQPRQPAPVHRLGIVPDEGVTGWLAWEWETRWGL